MGSGNCRALCPEAVNRKDQEIDSSGVIVDPNQISIMDKPERRSSRRSSEAGKQNSPNDSDGISQSPSTRIINGQLAPVIQSKYVANHLVVPAMIVLKKLSDLVRTFLKKELTQSPLLNEGAQWYLMPSGNYYSGEFEQGRPIVGTYLLANGNVYYGKSLKDKPEGMGVLITENGVLKGEFKAGQADGRCRLETKDMITEGEWVHGYLTEGKINTREHYYQGSLKKGVPEGKGTYKNLVAEVSYEGDFKKGLYNGSGVLKTPEYTYKGEFRDGKKQGFGTLQYNDRKLNPEIKIGQWDMDVLVG